MSNLTRRTAVVGAAAMPLIPVAGDGAPSHPDAESIRLREGMDQAWAREDGNDKAYKATADTPLRPGRRVTAR